jgi:hypothetical protein
MGNIGVERVDERLAELSVRGCRLKDVVVPLVGVLLDLELASFFCLVPDAEKRDAIAWIDFLADFCFPSGAGIAFRCLAAWLMSMWLELGTIGLARPLICM